MLLTNGSITSKQKAFADAYSPLHDKLVRFVQNMVWNNEDMKDIVSETALLSYERFETLRHSKALLSFMFTIASRLIYKYNIKKKLSFNESANYIESIADSAADGQTRLEAKELFRALNRLPYKQREAIVMFEISGFSLIEIQELQGDTLSAVKSRLIRGRETLRKMFEEKMSTEI